MFAPTNTEEEDSFAREMNRGHRLRQLRLLALADERERSQQQQASHCGFGGYDESASFCEEKKEDGEGGAGEEWLGDVVRILPTTKERVLDYNSYLAHQCYYDDLKHADMNYIDFGNVGHSGGRLIVEQRKSLGKGGLCWDAGFILGEHVVAHEHEWRAAGARPRVVELGAGTGLAGLLIAGATESAVTITDLPELAGLMADNVRRNCGDGRGAIASRPLRWGVPADYGGAPYDVVVGADLVTSLYDPRALAQTVAALSGPRTRVYISSRARVDRPHEEFDAELARLFERVWTIRRPSSRLRNPHVFILVAEGKRELSPSVQR